MQDVARPIGHRLLSGTRAGWLAATRAAVFASILMMIVMPFSAPGVVVGAAVLQLFWIWRDNGTMRSFLSLSSDGLKPWLPALALVIYFAARTLPPPFLGDAIPGVVTMALCLAAIYVVIQLFHIKIQT